MTIGTCKSIYIILYNIHQVIYSKLGKEREIKKMEITAHLSLAKIIVGQIEEKIFLFFKKAFGLLPTNKKSKIEQKTFTFDNSEVCLFMMFILLIISNYSCLNRKKWPQCNS